METKRNFQPINEFAEARLLQSVAVMPNLHAFADVSSAHAHHQVKFQGEISAPGKETEVSNFSHFLGQGVLAPLGYVSLRARFFDFDGGETSWGVITIMGRRGNLAVRVEPFTVPISKTLIPVIVPFDIRDGTGVYQNATGSGTMEIDPGDHGYARVVDGIETLHNVDTITFNSEAG